MDKAEGRLRLCFGSRKLFGAQNHLEENGYSNHKEWRREWVKERSNEFFVIGSKGETAGCQGCQMTSFGRGRFHITLRLPDALVPVGSVAAAQKRIVFETTIPYGYQALERALADGVAICFRFHRDSKGWRVMASTDVKSTAMSVVRSSRPRGAIGLDLNAGHIALTEIDASGNPVGSVDIPLVTYGLSSEQAKACIGDAIKEVISIAKLTSKPLVVESLDFQKKKRTLKDENPRYARMLSSFSYSLILKILKARAFDEGIDVHEVNPAYTSLIGRHKFKGRYGLSVHSAAAAVIARRGLNCCEVPTKGQQFHDTSPAQVLRRGEHVWKYWAKGAIQQSGVCNAPPGQGGRPLRSIFPTSRTEGGPIQGLPAKPRHASLQHCSGGDSVEIDKTLCF